MDKTFDFSQAKTPMQVPALQKLRQAQANHDKAQMQHNDIDIRTVFDQDVVQLIKAHMDNKEDKAKINGMIRLLFA